MYYYRFMKKTGYDRPVYRNEAFHIRGKPYAADSFWGFLLVLLAVLLMLAFNMGMTYRKKPLTSNL